MGNLMCQLPARRRCSAVPCTVGGTLNMFLPQRLESHLRWLNTLHNPLQREQLVPCCHRKKKKEEEKKVLLFWQWNTQPRKVLKAAQLSFVGDAAQDSLKSPQLQLCIHNPCGLVEPEQIYPHPHVTPPQDLNVKFRPSLLPDPPRSVNFQFGFSN